MSTEGDAKILDEVESLRTHLHYLAVENNTLDDPQVIDLSKKLDELLNKYMETE